MDSAPRKEVVWVGSCRVDLAAFPPVARRALGYALNVAQLGGKHPEAKPLKGFGGAGVLEVVEDHDRRTFRLIYTVRLAERIYALHAFQKKSTRGTKTPQHELEVVSRRLREAEEIHKQWLESNAGART
jgi:phage-related protein